VLVMMLVLVAVAVTTGLLTGYRVAGAGAAGLVLVGWLATVLRIVRPVPAGPHGDGPAPPGGASVREPRRPRPLSSGGAAVIPMDRDEPPHRAVALA
jgi:hypothetical protein